MRSSILIRMGVIGSLWSLLTGKARARAARDASLLIELFGDRAYEEARRRARESGDRHWSRVRSIIARRTGRATRLDTATRYLEE